MKKFAVFLLSGWFVVTYSGQLMAGPFALLNECSDMAAIMAAKYPNISRVCQYR